ncbi:MAG: hypothetical protein ABSG61_05335 [Gemmatimonadales bacterium]
MPRAVGQVLAAVFAVAASSASAQQLSVRLGGVRASYANAISGSAGVGTARLTWDAPQFVAALDASYARFAAGWWASQASGSFYGIRLVGSRAGVGLKADGEAGRVSDGVWSGLLAVGPVGSVLVGSSVLSAGVAVGAVRRIDSMSSGTIAGNVRARTDAGPWSFEGALDATHARGIDFADATAQVAYRWGPVDLSALAGGRTGDLGGKPWLQGRLAYRAAPWVTLEAQAGNYPRDISGFTSGSFLSVGVWLRPSGRRTDTRMPSVYGGGSRRSVTIESAEPGRERVTFVVPGAQQVAIAGEWNDWTPVALKHLDGERWQANVALGKGAHRFSLLVDGDRWVVPSGVPSIPDSFGGSVGLLVVD